MPHWSWKAPLWEMGVKSRDTSNQLYAREWCSSGPRKKKHHLIFMKQALSGRNQYKWQKGLNISLFITFWSLIISNVIIVCKLQYTSVQIVYISSNWTSKSYHLKIISCKLDETIFVTLLCKKFEKLKLTLISGPNISICWNKYSNSPGYPPSHSSANNANPTLPPLITTGP